MPIQATFSENERYVWASKWLEDYFSNKLDCTNDCIDDLPIAIHTLHTRIFVITTSYNYYIIICLNTIMHEYNYMYCK